MTGTGEGAPTGASPAPSRAAPAEPEEERIEIPAFLRRQAN
jgi:hypothetical protein